MTEPIHNWFGLTYASYLVLPRSILQSASLGVQQRLMEVLNDLREEFGHEGLNDNYDVRLRSERGRYVRDPYADYNRGRRRIERRKK